jgi:hypothetical protein
MGFNRVIGLRERLNDKCQFLLTPVQIIECTRHSTLIEDGGGAFGDGIAKLEPSMGGVEGF